MLVTTWCCRRQQWRWTYLWWKCCVLCCRENCPSYLPCRTASGCHHIPKTFNRTKREDSASVNTSAACCTDIRIYNVLADQNQVKRYIVNPMQYITTRIPFNSSSPVTGISLGFIQFQFCSFILCITDSIKSASYCTLCHNILYYSFICVLW